MTTKVQGNNVPALTSYLNGKAAAAETLLNTVKKVKFTVAQKAEALKLRNSIVNSKELDTASAFIGRCCCLLAHSKYNPNSTNHKALTAAVKKAKKAVKDLDKTFGLGMSTCGQGTVLAATAAGVGGVSYLGYVGATAQSYAATAVSTASSVTAGALTSAQALGSSALNGTITTVQALGSSALSYAPTANGTKEVAGTIFTAIKDPVVDLLASLSVPSLATVGSAALTAAPYVIGGIAVAALYKGVRHYYPAQPAKVKTA